jgi:simple sugar transport system permease protein
MQWLSPLLAVALTVLCGVLFFSYLGLEVKGAFYVFFIEPVSSMYGVGELLLKASPLCLIALGLAVGYRANIWNIGAEGQMVLGGIFGTYAAMYWLALPSYLLIPAILLMSILGGLLWAGIVAALKNWFNANELLTSLMLVYISFQLLLQVMTGTQENLALLQDPNGAGFPISPLFEMKAMLPMFSELNWSLWSTTRMHVGIFITLLFIPVMWLLVNRSFLGYQMLVAGQAPAAAAYSGFNQKKLVWTCLLISGGMAGLAGGLEMIGPNGQLQASWKPGYGFAAIIVAFVGRLQPIGIAIASLILSITYLGGESAQSSLSLPKSITLLFQGCLLFFLLACDLFIQFRLKWKPKNQQKTVGA